MNYSMTGLRVQRIPEIALLSMLPGSIANVKKGLLRLFLLAAWRIISRYWKQQTIPTIEEWAQEMIRLRRMEELTLRDQVTAFCDTWTQLDLFLDSDDMKRSLQLGCLMCGDNGPVCLFRFKLVPSLFCSLSSVLSFLCFLFCWPGFLGAFLLRPKTRG